MAAAQPSNFSFGYINNPSRQPVEVPLTLASPLKSAMKVPGRNIDNPLSTFREEQILERHEEMTGKEQARDLKIKTRVRIAKFFLRGVNFICSLIVLSMLSITFSIFNTTKALPLRNNLPAWAVGTKTWPQKVVLSVSCVSLALCLVVFWNYWRGGHRRAEKVAVYYTLFAVAFFIFSTIMWGIAAGILQSAKNNNNNKDVWGWLCVDNKRRQVFADKVDYALVCRMQSWSLVCCLTEVILECITILLYSVVFYRYYSKQRLQKSMDVRDRARSDLYLAQLRSQSVPKTPGFGSMSLSYSPHIKSPRFPLSIYSSNPSAAADDGYAGASTTLFFKAKPFSALAAAQTGFGAPAPSKEQVIEHIAAAPGEQTYDAVPIPGAYVSPLTSSGLA